MPYYYLTLIVIALDQLVKWLIQDRMEPYQSWAIGGDWLALTYAQNYGAAFGILQSQTLLFIGLTLVVLGVIWFNRRRLPEYPRTFQLGLAIALGGALGNFLDRLRLGFVVDFIDLKFWPVFNLADMAIVSGVGLVIWGLYQKDRKFEEQPQAGRLGPSEKGEEG